MPASEPTDEDSYGGYIQIRADYETYLEWWEFAQDYYTHEHALKELLEEHQEDRAWG